MSAFRPHLLLLACLALAAGHLHAQRPPSDEVASKSGPITVVPITHGTLELAQGATVVLIDPARRIMEGPPPPPPPPGAGPDWRPKLEPPTPVTRALYAGLAPPTVLLVTDNHEDHFDPAVIDIVRGPGTVIVAPEVVRSQIPGAGGLANGQRKSVGPVLLEAVPMYNDTVHKEMGMTEPFHTKGRGNGYIVTIDGTRFFIAGDTSCTPEIKALEKIDVAFLPMNLPFTMSPADAAACARAFHPRIVYPYHYAAQDLKGPAAFEREMQGSGIEVRLRDWYTGVPLPK